MVDDLLTLLKSDHRATSPSLREFNGLPVANRPEYFSEVVRALVGHEVVEELVVYEALLAHHDS